MSRNFINTFDMKWIWFFVVFLNGQFPDWEHNFDSNYSNEFWELIFGKFHFILGLGTAIKNKGSRARQAIKRQSSFREEVERLILGDIPQFAWNRSWPRVFGNHCGLPITKQAVQLTHEGAEAYLLEFPKKVGWLPVVLDGILTWLFLSFPTFGYLIKYLTELKKTKSYTI